MDRLAAPARAVAPARPRDTRLDVLKGVLIIGVVLGHFLETSGGRTPTDLYSGWYSEPQRTVLTALYVVHMPLFVLLAGVTASRRRLGHRIAQMVGLYLVLQTSYLLLRGADVTLDTLVHPVYAMWFLLAMAWWLFSLPFVHRLGRAALPVAVAVSVAAVLLPFDDTGMLTWARALCYWPFFVAGHLYGKAVLRRFAELDASVALRSAAVTVLVAVTAVFLAWGVDPAWYRGADTAASMDESGAVAVATRVVCSGVAVVCALAIMSLVPQRQGVLELVGRRSLPVYALHVPFVFAAESWFQDRGLAAPQATGVAVLMTVASVALLSTSWCDRLVRVVATRTADVMVLPSRLTPTTPAAGPVRPHDAHRDLHGRHPLVR